MAQILINLEPELKAKLQAKAKAAKRTMTSHLIHIIERDLDSLEIPVVGTVGDDGTIIWKMREKTWSAPITIEEELDRR